MQNEFADLEILINSIPALVAYIDCNMVLQFCNQAFKAWFNIKDESAGQTFSLIAGSKIFDQVQQHLNKVLVGESAHFQISVNAQNGFQYLDATLSPYFDQQRQINGFIFHCSDITEKNKTERALNDYFENASICLHWVNADGIIVWANQAELRLLDYSEEEYIGRHISEFHANTSAIDDIMTRLTNKQRIENYDADLVCKDGSIKHVTINSSALWEGDKFIHTRCFTIDVTERKLAAKLKEKNGELEKINNQLSSFAHIASHDLQEPLRKIQLNFDRLLSLEGDNFSERGKDLSQRITDSTNQMRNLIRDLLTFAQSNDYEGKLEKVDLNLIVKDTINALDAKITEKNATIRVEELPTLNIVPFQFHQLFLNLLSNALKFTRAGEVPYIAVSCELVKGSDLPDGFGEVDRSCYHLSVSDNGIGFDPEQSVKIFEMFYRLHGRTKYEGTGLGLPICKKIVENHKGAITAESKQNEGATFHIYLPVC